MTAEEKAQWQQQVAAAILDPAAIPAADKLRLLTEWPILRAWAHSVLKRNPDKVPAKTIDAYLRDALAWSGHLGDPAAVFNNGEKPAGFAGAVVMAQAKEVITTPSDVLADASVSSSRADVKEHNAKPQKVKLNELDHAEETPKQLQQRFEHMSEYRSMLPADVADRENEISDIFLQRATLGQRRDTLAELIEKATADGDHIQRDAYEQDLAVVAQQLIIVDQGLRQYFTLVDACLQYYSLNQAVMPMDELNKVNIKPAGPSRHRKPDYDKGQLDAMQFRLDAGTPIEGDLSDEELKEAIALRQKRDKDFLRDVRKLEATLEKGDEAVAEWRKTAELRAAELKDWGIELNDTAVANMQRVGMMP